MDIKHRFIECSPAKARELLDKYNTNNRKLKLGHISDLRREMEDGRWIYNGQDSVVIDTNGRMLNGQHMLHAIENSNTSQWILMITGIDPKAWDVMDTFQLLRTASDILGQSRNLLAIVRWHMRISIGNRKYCAAEIKEHYDAHKAAFNFCHATGTQDGLRNASIWASFAEYHMRLPHMAEEFCAAFNDPLAGIKQAALLRDKILRITPQQTGAGGGTAGMCRWEWAAYACMAHRDDRNISNIRRAQWD